MRAWETLLLDVGGTLACLGATALCTYVAHRVGWLARPAAALAAWLRREGGTLGEDTVLLIEQLVQAELRRHGLASTAPPQAQVPQPQAPTPQAGGG